MFRVAKFSFVYVFLFVVLLFGVLLLSACHWFDSNELKPLQFKIDGVSAFRISGYSISSARSMKDIGMFERVKIKSDYQLQRIPVDFMLKMRILNPNDGVHSSKKITCTIVKLDWHLMYNDTLLQSGVIEYPIETPPGGNGVVLPFKISANLFKFFNSIPAEEAYNTLINLGGAEGKTDPLKLDILPTVKSPLGTITYPKRIIADNKGFN